MKLLSKLSSEKISKPGKQCYLNEWSKLKLNHQMHFLTRKSIQGM